MICRPNSQWGDKTIFGSFLDTLAFTNTSFRTENNRIFYRQSFCRIIEYIKVSLLTGIKGLSAGKVKPG